MPKPDGTPDDVLDAEGKPITSDTQTTTSTATTKTDGSPITVTYTEAQYKGLQAVIAKRDGTIGTLTAQIVELEGKLAEAQSQHGAAVTEKTTVATQLTDAQSKVTQLQAEVTALQKKLSYQGIILKEFPDLASAASFIPETATEEEYRQKATEFRGTLKQYVDSRVKNVLDGSSPPIDQQNTTINASDDDKAYRDVVSLAGRPGKEKEYQEAYDRWQNILKAKQSITG
jgi:chromosome segregation ATPase